MPRTRSTIVAAAAAVALQLAPAGAQQSLPPCQVGLKVKGNLNYPGQIVAADPVKDSYQVRMDSNGELLWMTGRELGINFSCKSAGPQQRTAGYFVGSWEVFTPSAPNKEVIQGRTWLVYGPGAKGPPLTVSNDGTYRWELAGAAPISGRWRPLADNEIRPQTKGPAILLMQGYDNSDWQVWAPEYVRPADNRDLVTIEQYRGGLSLMGTRAR